MLVARAQLNFVKELVARFERNKSVMEPVTDHQSQYIAIIALLRSVGHVFNRVDCVKAEHKEWGAERWRKWKQDPIFKGFIEPARNKLLKEFQGGLQLRDSALGAIAVVADPGMPGGRSYNATFDAGKLCDAEGEAILPKIHAALDFWDRCLREAETVLA